MDLQVKDSKGKVVGSVEASEAAALVLLGVGPYLEALAGGMSAAS